MASSFFKGKCRWDSPAFYVFVVMASIGFVSTAASKAKQRKKMNLLTAQLCVDIVYGLLIGYLCANCMQIWAWLLVATILVTPMF